MKVLYLLENIIVNIFYHLFFRLVKPATEQEAEAAHDLVEQIILDPLNIFPKGKS